MQPQTGDNRRLFRPCPRQRLLRLCRPCHADTVLVFLATFCSLSISGCSTKTSNPARPAKPFAGIVVRVACPGDPTTTLVSRHGQAWSADSGAQVEVMRYDAAAEPDAMPEADAWVIPAAAMPQWANDGKLHAVPADLTKANPDYAWENILPDYRHKLLIWDQDVYGLPLLGDELFCYYRQDLFQDPRHSEAFEHKLGRKLSAPSTWQEFAEIAEYFNSRGLPSLPSLPAGDDDLDQEFYATAVSFARLSVREDDPKPRPAVEAFSFHCDLDTGEPRIHTRGFVQALEFLQHLQKYRSPGTAAESTERFRDGEAVLCLAGPAWIPRFRDKLGNKFAMCRVPGSSQVFDYHGIQVRAPAGSNFVPYLGAKCWLAVVPRTNPKPQAAFALLAFLSGPKTSRDLVIEPAWGGGIFRRDHLDQIGWEAFGLDRKTTEHMVRILRETVVHPQVKNPVLRLRIPDERPYQKALLAEIRAALLHGKDASQALAAAVGRWRELERRKDSKTRVAEYRLSLSLERNGE